MPAIPGSASTAVFAAGEPRPSLDISDSYARPRAPHSSTTLAITSPSGTSSAIARKRWSVSSDLTAPRGARGSRTMPPAIVVAGE